MDLGFESEEMPGRSRPTSSHTSPARSQGQRSSESTPAKKVTPPKAKASPAKPQLPEAEKKRRKGERGVLGPCG